MSTKVDNTYDLNKLKVEAVGGMSTDVDWIQYLLLVHVEAVGKIVYWCR